MYVDLASQLGLNSPYHTQLSKTVKQFKFHKVWTLLQEVEIMETLSTGGART
jgi:hypothetical protein